MNKNEFKGTLTAILIFSGIMAAAFYALIVLLISMPDKGKVKLEAPTVEIARGEVQRHYIPGNSMAGRGPVRKLTPEEMEYIENLGSEGKCSGLCAEEYDRYGNKLYRRPAPGQITVEELHEAIVADLVDIERRDVNFPSRYPPLRRIVWQPITPIGGAVPQPETPVPEPTSVPWVDPIKRLPDDVSFPLPVPSLEPQPVRVNEPRPLYFLGLGMLCAIYLRQRT